MHNINIVLYNPEIPGNTGSIGRTCVALNLKLILIKPYGFELNEKSVRRAGLDYWKYVNLIEYNSWKDFITGEHIKNEQLILFSKTAKQIYHQANYCQNSYLVFGSETSGLPNEILEKFANNIYKLPMYSDKVRSLNLSNVVTAASYEALRQINFSHTNSKN